MNSPSSSDQPRAQSPTTTEPIATAGESPQSQSTINRARSRSGSNPSRHAAPRRGPLKFLFYGFVRLTSRLWSVTVFDLRCVGRHLTEVEGGALILSTHQSHFDPVLIGVTFNERLNYLAKRSLFKNPLFGAMITLLDAIELDRDRSGLAGLKETLIRLKRGEKVLIFPEGTRSPDGILGPLKPGFLSVARRSRVPLIPVAITGAYEALPRGGRWPIRYPLRVAVGPAIEASQVSSLSDEELLALVHQRLESCCRQANAVSRL